MQIKSLEMAICQRIIIKVSNTHVKSFCGFGKLLTKSLASRPLQIIFKSEIFCSILKPHLRANSVFALEYLML